MALWIKQMLSVIGTESAGYDRFLEERALDFLEMVIGGLDD